MKPQCDQPCLNGKPCIPTEDHCPLSLNSKNIQKTYICSNCGKELKYKYKFVTSPCCHAPILTYYRIMR